MSHRLTVLAAAVALALPLVAPAAYAQATQGRIGRSEQVISTAPGYYVYHQPGEATIQVAVEGAVRTPGLYEVAVGTDLGRVLALTGGPAYDAREDNQRQRVEVRLFRPNEGAIYATTLQDVAANPGAYPDLREGDSIVVDVIRKRRFGWQEAGAVAGILGGAAFVISAIVGG